MNKLLLAAAALLALPSAAQAAVTISFSDPAAGKGVITIDTAHLGTAEAGSLPGRTLYRGDGTIPFLTASFTDSVGAGRLLDGGDLDGYLEFDSTSGEVSVGYNEGNGTPATSSLLYLTASGTTLGTFDGMTLPNFATASSVFFTVTPKDGGDPINGEANSISMTADVSAVPEPATWALMIAGFAATGAMLRRRRGTLAVA